MTTNLFTKASRRQKKLRMSLAGPSGSGKTYTALAIATGLAQGKAEAAQGGKIAVLDTERGSASLYSDRFNFDVVELESFNPENYIKMIEAAGTAGYSVLIIDSLSHAWFGQGGVLDQVNKRGGNSFTDGWGKVGTPLQNRLMDAILNAPMHIIATMRVKSEYVIEADERGKSVPRRVGLKEVQREGTEYEFDIVGLLDLGNTMVIEKSRLPDLTGAIISKPNAKFAEGVLAWLNKGEPALPPSAVASGAPASLDEAFETGEPATAAVTQPTAPVQSDQERWTQFCKANGFGAAEIEAALGTRSVATWMREHGQLVDDAMTKLTAHASRKQGPAVHTAGQPARATPASRDAGAYGSGR